MAKFHLAPKLTIAVVLILLAVAIVTIFGVMASSGGMAGKVRGSSWEDSSSSSMLILPDDMSSKELENAIVVRFHASDDETDDDGVQFDDALSALEKMVEDGNPVPIHGVDGLYVGGVGAAYNFNSLQAAGITHILSLENAAPCKWPYQFHCLHIQGLWDTPAPENRISQYFDQTLPFIDDALTSGGRILVHCWAGKSRSVSTITAYLIEHYDVTVDEALEQIRVNRPRAQPNEGYMDELADFYRASAKKNKQNDSNWDKNP